MEHTHVLPKEVVLSYELFFPTMACLSLFPPSKAAGDLLRYGKVMYIMDFRLPPSWTNGVIIVGSPGNQDLAGRKYQLHYALLQTVLR